MDPLDSINENEDDDDIFTDALLQCSADDPPETSTSDSTFPDSKPIISPEPQDSHSNPPPSSSSPPTLLRRRSIRHRTNESSDSGTDIDSINVTRRSFRHKPRYINLKQDENFTAKPYSDEAQKTITSQALVPETEEKNEESTITTATIDAEANDSADSVPRLGDSSSSILELIAGLWFVEKPIQIKEVLNFDYTKLSPVAYVPIISCDDVGRKDYESNVEVGKLMMMGERVIPSRHRVQVTVSLRVPESGYNRNLGVFQARVDFLLSNGKTIASLSQPCMLRFRSEPIRLIMTFLKIAPLITGYTSETQILNVKMRGFVEGNIPTSCLKVTLEQRPEYQPGAGIPEIYDASLVVESELPFFKRMIWQWKMSIFIWISMMAFFTELIFILVFCRPIIIPRTRQRAASARGPATLNSLQIQS
ncbi:seipin [Trifolium pratense]|uniref:Seipin n=1 Tax=Trifolium pratense TaxID=57577 RepID=A0A2K3PQT2_TRIPR|nr:seipin [Trifolium pratense]